jgi:hypothetical protein
MAIEGSVIEGGNKYRLFDARRLLGLMKDYKLKNYSPEHAVMKSWEIDNLVKQLDGEVQEFKDTTKFFSQLSELADISNMVDIIAVKLIDEMRRY